MRLYIGDKIYEGTPEEILELASLIDNKTKTEITSYASGMCSIHRIVCCPVCK